MCSSLLLDTAVHTYIVCGAQFLFFTSCTIFFHVAVEPPCFLVAPKDVHVVKTGFLMLPCLATSPGGVETRTQWFYDHTPLATLGEKHAVLKNGSLLLSNIYPAQAGNYSCRASNQYGVSIVTAHIMVSSEYLMDIR